MFKENPQTGKLQNILILMILSLLPGTLFAQLDDPTRPPGFRLVLPGGKTAAAEMKYILSSIRISSLRRLAVVNDKSVEAGDMVNGAEVIAILPAAVKLKKNGQVFSIRLVSQVVKKTRVQ